MGMHNRTPESQHSKKMADGTKDKDIKVVTPQLLFLIKFFFIALLLMTNTYYVEGMSLEAAKDRQGEPYRAHRTKQDWNQVSAHNYNDGRQFNNINRQTEPYRGYRILQ